MPLGNGQRMPLLDLTVIEKETKMKQNSANVRKNISKYFDTN